MPHYIPFDDPVTPAHGEECGDSRSCETVGAVFQDQSADPDETQVQSQGLDDVRLHSDFEKPAIRVATFEGMNMDCLAVGGDPKRAGQAHKVFVCGQLRHASFFLEQHAAW